MPGRSALRPCPPLACPLLDPMVAVDTGAMLSCLQRRLTDFRGEVLCQSLIRLERLNQDNRLDPQHARLSRTHTSILWSGVAPIADNVVDMSLHVATQKTHNVRGSMTCHQHDFKAVGVDNTGGCLNWTPLSPTSGVYIDLDAHSATIYPSIPHLREASRPKHRDWRC